MLHKYSIKMTLDHIDSNNNIVSSGHLIVGKSNDIKEAHEMLNDTKHSFVDLSYGISNTEDVNYKRKRVNTNNFIALNNKGSLRESVRNIEILENF